MCLIGHIRRWANHVKFLGEGSITMLKRWVVSALACSIAGAVIFSSVKWVAAQAIGDSLAILPANIDFVLTPYTEQTQQLEIQNNGGSPIEWSLLEIPSGGVSSTTTVKTAAGGSAGAQVQVDWTRPHAPDSLIVGFHPGVSNAASANAHAAVGGTVTRSFNVIPADVVQLPPNANIQAMAAMYRARPNVAYVEPNYIHHISDFPNDPSFDLLWGMHNIGQTGGTVDADIDAPEAWDIQKGSHTVIVGVIDTGIDYTHPDLIDNLWVNEPEFNGTALVDDDGNGIVDDVFGARWTGGFGAPTSGDPMDGHGHGTHVSGTIGAVGDNATGPVGVNWNVQLMGLKFLDDAGFGDTADAVSAIEYAIDKGAHLTSNSWGGGPFSQALKDAVDAAGAAGQVFVAAAGNAGTDNDITPHYPSNYTSDNIIAVAASDHNDNKPGFSQYGLTSVDLAAPGASIYSTWTGGGYSTISGTSMATPHVSGVAALILAQLPSATPAQVKQWILDSVDLVPAFDPLGPTPVLTGGRLNAAKALNLAGAAWLDETPTSGTINPGESAFVDVTADASGLADGFFDTATLEFSGDPAGPLSVPVSLSVIELVKIDHTPLTDTTTPGPYSVCADITVESGALVRADLNWSTDGGATFSTVAMTNSGGATYCATIPDQPIGTTICYYIEGEDSAGNVEVNPLAFPADMHCFQMQGIPNLTATVVEGDLNFVLPPNALEERTLHLENDGTWPTSWSLGEQSAAAELILPETAGSVHYETNTYLPYGSAATSRRATRRVVTDAYQVHGTSDVLILASGDDPTVLRSGLQAFPDIGAVDYVNVSTVVPALGDLVAYDAVILMTNAPVAGSATTGNVLADYVDGGGAVIEAVASFATGGGWELSGRFVSDGYSTFTHGAASFSSHTLGSYDSAHPIMQGITTFSDTLVAEVALASGAELVASWSNGRPVVATKNDNVVGVNVFGFDDGTWSGDVPLLFHNAVSWLNSGWIDEQPKSGVLQAGESVNVVISADSSDLEDGFNECLTLSISGDPDGPIDVPACISIDAYINIVHTPLTDTLNEAGPYAVCATITADAGLNTSELWLYYSLNGGAFNQVALTNSGGDTYCANIPGQPAGTEVSYYLSAEDAIARVVTHPFGAPADTHVFNVVGVASGTVFSEDFETGEGEFTIDNGSLGMWHVTTTCNATLPGHSTPSALWFGLEGNCNYDIGLGAQGTATSSSISLLGATSATLEFNYYLHTEGLPASYDRASVEISQDGGPFTAVAHNNPGEAAYTLVDPSGGWLSASIDLAAMAGSNIRVRFTFNSVDGVANALPGFYVDDVVVVAEGGSDDTTPPVITLNGASSMTLECGVDSYTELGATAEDDVDGSVPVTIGGDAVDDHTPGVYVVTYDAADSSGNVATQVTRTVTVQDTLPPGITLNGASSIALECGIDTYTELGATASDLCDPNVSVVIGGDTVDASTLGVYVVTYDATDESGNSATQVTRTVTVEDTTAPVITLNGASNVTLECNVDAYVEPGAVANDACDPGVSVVVGGDTVDPSSLGVYVVTYNATDASGNAATQVTRTVTVEDTLSPAITLNGPSEVTLTAGVDTYTEQGATANDLCDPSVSVVVGGDVVDDSTVGVYVVTYDATDASGNSATQVTRTVNVVSGPGGGDPPPANVASADVSTSSGFSSGSYTDTHAQDDNYESFVEQHSGGRPSSRFDSVDHVWSFPVDNGNHVFHADAYRIDAGDADSAFEFYWSTSASGPWTHMFDVTKTSDDDSYQSFDLGSPPATVYVRVTDSNQTPGQNSNDTILVDHMYVDGGAPPTDPPAAASSPSPSNGAVDVSVNPTLSWDMGAGAASHDVYFGTSPTLEAGDFQGNQTSTTFEPGALAGLTTYYWRIDEVNDIGTTTGTVWSFTTLDPNAGPATMHISAITASTLNASKGNKHGHALVSVVDDLGNPVSGATVTVTFTGSYNETVVSVTNGSGVAESITTAAQKGGVSVNVCVDNVSHGSLIYNPGDNVTTCASG